MVGHEPVPHVEHVLDLVFKNVPGHPQRFLIGAGEHHRGFELVQVFQPDR